MKFKFCGDLDCPDWLLAEISSLSKVSSVKLKLLCPQVLKLLTGDEQSVDYQKIGKNLRDAKLDDTQNVKGALAALLFMIKGAVGNQVPNEDFVSELQQLGLPKEHSGVLAKAVQTNAENISTACRNQSLRINKLADCKVKPNFYLVPKQNGDSTEITDQKIIKCDSATATILVSKNSADSVSKNYSQQIIFSLDSENLNLLVYELKQAQSIMERFV